MSSYTYWRYKTPSHTKTVPLWVHTCFHEAYEYKAESSVFVCTSALVLSRVDVSENPQQSSSVQTGAVCAYGNGVIWLVAGQSTFITRGNHLSQQKMCQAWDERQRERGSGRERERGGGSDGETKMRFWLRGVRKNTKTKSCKAAQQWHTVVERKSWGSRIAGGGRLVKRASHFRHQGILDDGIHTPKHVHAIINSFTTAYFSSWALAAHRVTPKWNNWYMISEGVM